MYLYGSLAVGRKVNEFVKIAEITRKGQSIITFIKSSSTVYIWLAESGKNFNIRHEILGAWSAMFLNHIFLFERKWFLFVF